MIRAIGLGKAGGQRHHCGGKQHRVQRPSIGSHHAGREPGQLQHRDGDGGDQNRGEAVQQGKRSAPQGPPCEGGGGEGGKDDQPCHLLRGGGFGRAKLGGPTGEALRQRPVSRGVKHQAQRQGEGGQQGEIGKAGGRFGPNQQGDGQQGQRGAGQKADQRRLARQGQHGQRGGMGGACGEADRERRPARFAPRQCGGQDIGAIVVGDRAQHRQADRQGHEGEGEGQPARFACAELQHGEPAGKGQNQRQHRNPGPAADGIHRQTQRGDQAVKAIEQRRRGMVRSNENGGGGGSDQADGDQQGAVEPAEANRQDGGQHMQGEGKVRTDEFIELPRGDGGGEQGDDASPGKDGRKIGGVAVLASAERAAHSLAGPDQGCPEAIGGNHAQPRRQQTVLDAVLHQENPRQRKGSGRDDIDPVAAQPAAQRGGAVAADDDRAVLAGLRDGFGMGFGMGFGGPDQGSGFSK